MGGKMTLMPLKSVLRAWSRQLTWPWIAALVLLAGVVAFYLSVVIPTRHALDDLKVHVKTLRHDENRLQMASIESAKRTPAGQLDQFYQAFPSESSVPDAIERLIEIAQKKGLNPKQAEYRVIRNTPGELIGYHVTLPIKGAYPKVLSFVFAVLSGTHNLSLDNISFQRQKIGDSVVEATLLMTLYIKRGRAIEH